MKKQLTFLHYQRQKLTELLENKASIRKFRQYGQQIAYEKISSFLFTANFAQNDQLRFSTFLKNHFSHIENKTFN